ncbi:15-hydroxyprostaglandin dehydrogenase [NAD(+)] [Anabrus simplex]|uniref:15-hydroxyprostaglandin dehydrogenase [NAD(+)] n=1 Tax=Anabrus simplex TaxID=316456 RepID=UPI0034DCCA97
MDLNGKVALVTGGASGIGLAVSRELLNNGSNVVVCDVNVDLARYLMEELLATFGKDRVLFIRTDVTKESDFEEAIQTTKNYFKRLDIVVNSAGIFDDIDWEPALEVNLKGVIRGTLLALKYMGKDNGGEGGIIINIASLASIDFYPTSPIYCATKHAVLALSKCFGMPFHYTRTGVRVVTLCPGVTSTPFLASFHTRLMSPSWMEPNRKLVNDLKESTPDVVARSIVRVICEAESGSVWVSEGGETYSVELPDRKSLKVLS